MVPVPQGGRDAPGDEFLPVFGASGRAARLTGHAPRHMKQGTISDPWYYVVQARFVRESRVENGFVEFIFKRHREG